MAKILPFRSRRDPVLGRLFRESGHSYEAGVTWLIDKLRDSFAQPPVAAAPCRVTYRAGTLDQVEPMETPPAKEALVTSQASPKV